MPRVINNFEKVNKAREYIRLLTNGIVATAILSEFYNNTVVFKVLFQDNKWYTVTVEMDGQHHLKKLIIKPT